MVPTDTNKINVIVAIDKNNGIGFEGKLLYEIDADLKMFKTITKDSVMIMGRKTYESIGFPLPGRISIVISSTEEWLTVEQLEHIDEGKLIVVSSLDVAISTAQFIVERNIFVIGGYSVYREVIERNLADSYYITEIEEEALSVDTYFPTFDPVAMSLVEASRETFTDVLDRHGKQIDAFSFVRYDKV